MKTIDGDLKKLQDDLNETRNIYNQVAKKDGVNYITKDLGDIIYNSPVSSEDFVEKLGSEALATVITIVHKYEYRINNKIIGLKQPTFYKHMKLSLKMVQFQEALNTCI
jgi:hypothetical protein